MRKIFLACPYGHVVPLVMQARFERSNEVAAQILRARACVFSQVSMPHPVNGHLANLGKAGIGRIWARSTGSSWRP